MVWDKGWDKVFKKNKWGKYPAEPLMRYICKNYPNFKLNKKINVLEVGCGTGANLNFFCNEGFKVFGIDGSQIAINKAKKFLKNQNNKASLKVGDILNIQHKDKSMDIIVDVECIYANSFVDSKTIMNEIYRILKKNGVFISITFSTKTWGYGNGKKYKNEKNTFVKVDKGALKNEYGLTRYSSKSDINKLYRQFKIIGIEKVSRTINNGENLIEEWVIINKKY